MTTISDITDGLKARVETLTTTDYAVRGVTEWSGPIPASGNAVAVVVEYDGTTYDAAMGGQADDLAFKLTFLTPKVSDRTAKDRLYGFCDTAAGSATSVRAAVNGSLGGVVAFATVRSNTGVQEYRPGGDEGPAYLGVEFVVAVAT